MKLGVVAAVNRREVLEQNLLRSPLIAEQGTPLRIKEGFASAGQAYNEGMRELDADVIVFAHQDVYLPGGWERRLADAIRVIEQQDAEWAVLGVYGVRDDSRHAGLVWSTGLQRECDARVTEPQPIVSADELVLVLRRDSGLEFDESLPGFHLYGTDIVQTALDRGLGAYVFHGPVIHNSTPTNRLDASYWRAHRYVREKWSTRLPIPTCVVGIPVSRRHRMRLAIRAFKKGVMSNKPASRMTVDAVQKARELGYELESELVEI